MKSNDQGSEKLQIVDYMKGIAILAIILTHSIQKLPFQSPVCYLLQYGQMGCQLFFLLSAFTLCLSWEKADITTWNFYKKRYKRIVTGYYTMIIVFLLYHCCLNAIGILGNKNSINPLAIIINFLLLNGLVPFANNCVVPGGWYIGTTVIFYAIFPFLFPLYKKLVKYNVIFTYGFTMILLVMSVSSQIILSIILKRTDVFNNNTFIYFSIVNQLPSISVGFILWNMYSNKKINKVKVPFTKFFVLSIINFILFHTEKPMVYSMVPFISSISFLYLFIFLYSKKSFDKLRLVLKKIGQNSFAIYLVHTFFAWSMPSFILLVLNKFHYSISMQGLWYILVIPIVLCSCLTGDLFSKFLIWIEGIIYGRVKN